MSEPLIDLLRCPITGQTLRPGEDLDAARFPEGAWVSEDRSVAYPIRDGFPILLKDEAVTMNSGE